MAEEAVSPGAALVKFRWDKATQSERLAVGQALKRARARARRARKAKGTVRSKSTKNTAASR